MAKKKLTPREEKGARTREAIYEASVTLFTKKGYDNVTVDDICHKVGVTKGAFYYHFKSKDQVLREKFLDIDDFTRDLLEEFSNIDDFIEKLYAHSEAIMTFISDLGLNWTKLVFHAEIGPDTKRPYLSNLKRPVYHNNAALLREGQERGLIRNDKTSEEMALLIVHSYRGVIYDWCLSNGAYDLVETSKELLDILIEGLLVR
jgi:AcrR family transcriptional regulator